VKKVIVTTTIQSPTIATCKFSEKQGWQLIVVGDLRTPHAEYERLNCVYMHPDEQRQKYPELSDSIGWNSIQRRNIGFVEAWKRGADVVATVDDDNIPYESWGKDLYVGREVEIDCFEPEAEVFDPLSITKSNHLWHRGYPIDLLNIKNRVRNIGKVRRKVLIQADLWDGDPDVDAIARITYRPTVRFDEVKKPFCSNKVSPVNSQNTFLAREVLPYYCVLPHAGRMDDIWPGYFVQVLFPNSLIYNKATVYQDRNNQDPCDNLEKEILGYRKTLELVRAWQNHVNNNNRSFLGLPDKSLSFYNLYRAQFDE
jgi:hypothetical protein